MAYPAGGDYYGEKYFDWQKQCGMASAVLDKWKFEKYTDGSKIILDFGCGGGYILEKLEAAKKFGVEINPIAREEASKKNITVFDRVQNIPNDLFFDVIISNHPLEHVHDPTAVLKDLRKHLKKGGVITFFLPFDDWRRNKKYDPKDINNHLFTWTPLNLGNLFRVAGYTDIQSGIVRKPWLIPWMSQLTILKSYTPNFLYNFLCRMRSVVQGIVEIRITASTG